MHTTPSVFSFKNVHVVFNRHLTIDREINTRALPDGVETVASVLCPSMTVPAVAFHVCNSLYLTNVVIQGDSPADLDPDPSSSPNHEDEEFPPLDDDDDDDADDADDADGDFEFPFPDRDEDDADFVFPPLDRDDVDHGMCIIFLVEDHQSSSI